MTDRTISLYNTLTRRKDVFTPIDPSDVRMYVCGPTVYDFAHIGNARPVLVFDVLYRLLRYVYGENHVTYARNITDVDDKINARAARDGRSIRDLTEQTVQQYHEDVAALGCLPPDVEPRATEHIDEMKALCETLVAKGHAYVAENHVLFRVGSMSAYGRLSNRTIDEMEAGARVEVAPYKENAMDFVLWKPSRPGDPAWPSPCGIPVDGRPGWHIECSAMAAKHLGTVFDIHGGGVDLVFPHHENEIAQSCCAHGTDRLANVWMHNGLVRVEGETMSKSRGNFITMRDLLQTRTFGGQQWHGRVIRWAMLTTHYRQPIDWTVDRLQQARAALMDLSALRNVPAASTPHEDVVAAVSDDLNTPKAIAVIHGLAKQAAANIEDAGRLKASLKFLGLYDNETREELNPGVARPAVDEAIVEKLVAQRQTARDHKDWAESDRIRDDLSAMGVVLKDGKDPETGETRTSWSLKE